MSRTKFVVLAFVWYLAMPFVFSSDVDEGQTRTCTVLCPNCPSCAVCNDCSDVAKSLAICKNALTKRVPCDSCCGEVEPWKDSSMSSVASLPPSSGTSSATESVGQKGEPSATGRNDSTGAVQDAPAPSLGVERGQDRVPLVADTAGTQPSAPDSNGPKEGAPQAVTHATRPASRTGDSLGGESSWHPAAGLTAGDGVWFGHLGTQLRFGKDRDNVTFTYDYGRVRGDSEAVPVVIPNHPDDYDCKKYGCNDAHTDGTTRDAGGGSRKTWAATVMGSWTW